jgi:predicted phage terminase large subunit-like protein
MFPLARVDELRETVGARHFASQMMLDPMPLDRARLEASALCFYDDEFDARSARLGGSAMTGLAFYWDPSAAHKRNDASVCVLIFRDDRNRRAFIHDCVYLEADDDDPHPLATQCGRVLDFMENRGLKNIAIEVNGIGNALPEILRREAGARGQTANVIRITNHENKEARILDAIEPLLGTGRLYAHERVRETNLLDEMADWTPNGWTHDDGLDAVAGALRLAPIPLRPRGTPPRPIRAQTDFLI